MIDPRARIALLGFAGLLAITLERPGSLLVLALACAAPLPLLGLDRRWWRRGLLVVLAIVWSTVLSQGLFYAEQPRVPLAHIGPLWLYREGVVYGLAQSLRFVALALGGIALAVSTPTDRMHAALLRMRVPFGLALMTATALRFLPDIGREVAVVRRARASRGRPSWRRTPWQWLLLEVGLLRPVVARAWRRAQNLGESLDTRGFDPLAPRAARRALRFGPLDAAVVILGGTVTLAAVTSRLLYLLYASDTLYIPTLRPLYGFVRSWL